MYIIVVLFVVDHCRITECTNQDTCKSRSVCSLSECNEQIQINDENVEEKLSNSTIYVTNALEHANNSSGKTTGSNYERGKPIVGNRKIQTN